MIQSQNFPLEIELTLSFLTTSHVLLFPSEVCNWFLSMKGLKPSFDFFNLRINLFLMLDAERKI